MSSSCSQMASCRPAARREAAGPGRTGAAPQVGPGQCGPAARRALPGANCARRPPPQPSRPPKTPRRSRSAALTPSRAGSAQHQTHREKAPEPAVLHLQAAASSAVNRQRRFGARLVFGRNGQRTRSPRVMLVQRRWLRRGPLGSPCHSADRHRSAPDDTLLAHAGVSNKEPNAPLESRTRAHRTPRLPRQIKADLTEGPGAPKARALAKLRYSPWPHESSVRRRSGHTASPRSARRRRRRSWRSAVRVRPCSPASRC